jgi:hypothetical protein
MSYDEKLNVTCFEFRRNVTMITIPETITTGVLFLDNNR